MTSQQQQADRIGWIGLGLLGFEMTQHLQKYLHTHKLPNLTVWNRTATKAVNFCTVAAPEVHVVHLIEDLFVSAADGSRVKANVIFTSLTNDAAVEKVYETLIRYAAIAQERTTFVDTGTLYPELSRRLQKELADLPQHHIYLQCPVFGRPEDARAAHLLWVASGDTNAVDRLRPYFEIMTSKVLDLKATDVTAASTLKLLGNFILMSNTSILAESVNIARKSNLDPQHLISWVDAFLPVPLLMGYSRRFVGGVEDEVGVNMTVGIATKDIKCLRRWAKTSGAPTPVVDAVYENFAIGNEKGYNGKWDFLLDNITVAVRAVLLPRAVGDYVLLLKNGCRPHIVQFCMFLCHFFRG